MRRFVSFLILLLVSVPVGISLSGCAKKTSVQYCNASTGDSGVQVGQLTSIVMQPVLYGISLNYGQIGQLSQPAGTDCKGSSVAISTYTYGTRDRSVVDVNPSNGALCAGSWNRSTNVIPDYTVCTPPASPSLANAVTYLTAEAQGVTSNPIPVFTHPVVTSIVLGPPSANCATDPATNCNPALTGATTTAPAYVPNACVSQAGTAQLAARVFAGTAAAGTLRNISAQVGHISFTAQTPGLVAIDENGVATAQQPGSTVITAGVANAGSSAGFFSTCPPISLTLAVPNTTATSIAVNQNFSQPITATAADINGHVLTGLALEFVSTTPTTIPAGGNGTITPIFPGAASITAICQPPSCNPSPFNQIGLLGNGKPLTSNAIGVTTPGTSSTILFIGSTNSRYIVPVDFTTSSLGVPVQLPYQPNSMVISLDGSSIYMGSSTELMVFNTSSNGLAREDVTVPGVVLAVSPDSSTIVIADTTRKLVYLESAAGGVITQFGGVGTHAQWSPDSQTVYITGTDAITANPLLLVHSTFTGWYSVNPAIQPLDVAVTVPSVGAYFAGTTATTAVGYCPASNPTTTNGQPTVNNTFYPPADTSTAITDRLAATNDGRHILGASATNNTLTDLFVTLPTGPCPSAPGAALQFTSVPSTTPLTGIAPTAITGILPSSDSSAALITYTGTGGVLPDYAPSASGTAAPGTLRNIPLLSGAIAPVAGTWSTDNLTFFAGTSGDNLVHLITRPTTAAPLTDSRTIAPALPATGGGTATPNLLVQKPRKTT